MRTSCALLLLTSALLWSTSALAEKPRIKKRARSVVGVYDGRHPHWKDTVIISADGRYRRGNGDAGSWRFDGRTLVLDWDRWGTAKLRTTKTGFFSRKQKFRLTRKPSPAVGRYRGTHPHWKDTVVIRKNGRYARGNGDPGSWSFDGKVLILDWDNWGTARLEPTENGYYSRKQRFRLVRLDAPTRPEPKPTPSPPPQAERDCGTGDDDPGCAMVRGGQRPMDAATFQNVFAVLEGESNGLTRSELVDSLLGKRLMTARQFGKILPLWGNELTRFEVAEKLVERIVDRSNALASAKLFNNSITRQDFVELVSK